MPDFGSASQAGAASAPAPSSPSTPSAPSSSKVSPGAPSAQPKMTSAQFRAKMSSTADENAFTRAREAPSEPEVEVPETETTEPAESSESATEPEVENPLDTESDEDYSWLESVKAYRQVHGLNVEELLGALAEGNIPEALWDKLFIDGKDGEQTWRDSLSDVRNNGLRARNYHAKTTALAQERAKFAEESSKFNTEREQLLHLVSGWKNDATGKSLLAGLRHLGLPVMEMAQALAQELQAVDQLGPGAMELYEAKAKMEAELQAERERLKFWQAKQEQEARQRQEREATARQEATVKHIHERAVKLFGDAKMPITDGAWNLFTENLNPLWAAAGGPEAGPPTDSDIRDAFRITREQIQAYVAEHASSAQPQSPRLSKVPLDPPAPKRQPGRPVAGKPKQISSSEFRKRLGLG